MADKILFLDVDGVLNSSTWFAKEAQKDNLCSVDPEALARLKRVIEATDAKIILSSTWRLLPQFVSYLEHLGLTIAGATPALGITHRGSEITTWLTAHPNVTQYAIIDDDLDAGDGAELASRFVETDAEFGILEIHERMLIEILKRD